MAEVPVPLPLLLLLVATLAFALGFLIGGLMTASAYEKDKSSG